MKYTLLLFVFLFAFTKKRIKGRITPLIRMAFLFVSIYQWISIFLELGRPGSEKGPAYGRPRDYSVSSGRKTS